MEGRRARVFTPRAPSLVIVVGRQVVGEGVHGVLVGPDAVEVGEDVVGGEADELAPPKPDTAEEVIRVVGVAEAHDHARSSHARLVDGEHLGSSHREVAIEGAKEEPRELPSTPPARHGPDPELVLHDDPSGVHPFRPGAGRLERRAVELHAGACGCLDVMRGGAGEKEGKEEDEDVHGAEEG